MLLGLFACSSSDDDDGAPSGGVGDGVSLFTSAAAITFVSGAQDVNPTSFAPTSDGLFLMVDASSGSVLVFDERGRVSVFTSQDELENLVGAAVELGVLDEILLGTQQGAFLGADFVSGLLLRLEADGTPAIHATEAQVTAFTGRSSARMNLPRFLLNNQYISQELVTRDILLFGTSGASVNLFVSGTRLSVAAGVNLGHAIVAGWTRGGRTGSAFARFRTAANIVKMEVNGTLTRHVDAVRLAELFPDVTDLKVIGLVSDTEADELFILVGDGDRGVGVAIVNDDPPTFSVDVFTSEEDFTDEIGADYDISAIGVLSDGDLYAIDRQGINVLAFSDEGIPMVAADRDSIARESGTATPEISTGVRLGETGVIVPEDTTGNLLLVE